MSWLPDGFVHPARLDLLTGHHLRPIREADVDLDYAAVMGSRERLWSIFGDAWGWPPATMTHEQDRADLARHEDEIARGLSFAYLIFDGDESEVVGCAYIDPPESAPDATTPDTTTPDAPAAPTAVVSWWVVDDRVGTALDTALDEAIPRWLETAWPFESVRYGV
jgi:RimJ/RimL family protein N-acetyltransferase